MSRKGCLLALLGVVAIAGHAVFWYLPRARPAAPRPGSAVAALLASETLPYSVWVPYPHQNLAHLRRGAGLEPESFAALARLAELPAPAVPGFGPLSLPPSSELALATDKRGERYVLRARVYPTLAVFARLAGRLAGNPWLAGGELEVEGRPVAVRWDGTLWQVASPAQLRVSETPGAASDAGLAVLRLGRPIDPLPAGRYRLLEDASGLMLRSDAAPAAVPFRAAELTGFDAFLLACGRKRRSSAPRASAFFHQDAGGRELPRVATFAPAGRKRWTLPGESLLEVMGREPRAGRAAGFDIAALDAGSLERAERLAPRLAELAASDSGRRLVWGLWLDLRGGLAEVGRIADTLAEVPLAPRREVARWRDARVFLTPLVERYDRLSLVITTAPDALELRLDAAEDG